MSSMNRFASALLLATGLVASATAAQAAYPEHTITAIIPFSTGGQSDVQGRIIAQGLTQILGQSVVVENKPGAGGNLGISIGERAKPDGYTIVLSSIALTVNPGLYKVPGWDPEKIQPVAILATTPITLTVNAAKYPTDTLMSFVARAKANPGKLNFSSSSSTINERLFSMAAGIEVTIVNYPGAGEATTSTASGETDASTAAVLVVAPFTQAPAKVRVLAVSGSKRSSMLPDVPSAAEAGLPGFSAISYIMMVVPKATPKDIQVRLNDAANKLLGNAEIVEKFKNVATDMRTSTIAEAEDFFKKDIAQYKKVIAEGKIALIE